MSGNEESMETESCSNSATDTQKDLETTERLTSTIITTPPPTTTTTISSTPTNNDNSSVSTISDLRSSKDLEDETSNDSERSDTKNAHKGTRELKLLLELSKEANLETNISHKRRSIDPIKLIEKIDPNKAQEMKKRLSNVNNKINEQEIDFEEAITKTTLDKFDKTLKEQNLKRKNVTSIVGGAVGDAYLKRKSLKLDEKMVKVLWLFFLIQLITISFPVYIL